MLLQISRGKWVRCLVDSFLKKCMVYLDDILVMGHTYQYRGSESKLVDKVEKSHWHEQLVFKPVDELKDKK